MTENTNKKRPSHAIYAVVGDGPGADWTQIGLAFPHKDGLGIALVLKEQPTSGRLALRAIPAEKAPKPVVIAQPNLPIQLPVRLPDPLRRMA